MNKINKIYNDNFEKNWVYEIFINFIEEKVITIQDFKDKHPPFCVEFKSNNEINVSFLVKN